MPSSIHAGLFLQPVPLPGWCHLQTPLKCLLLPSPGHWKWCKTGQVPGQNLWYPCSYWRPTGDSPQLSPLTTQLSQDFTCELSAHLGHCTLTCCWLPDPLSLPKTLVSMLASSLSASSGGNHPVWWNCRGHTLSDNPWLNPYPGMCLGNFLSEAKKAPPS